MVKRVSARFDGSGAKGESLEAASAFSGEEASRVLSESRVSGSAECSAACTLRYIA